MREYLTSTKPSQQGAEVELQAKLRSRLSLNAAYTYIPPKFSTIRSHRSAIPTPACHCCAVRNIRHGFVVLSRFVVGVRTLAEASWAVAQDDDFDGLGILHAAGYARVDLGGWYAINSRITAYANVANALNDHYNEVVGYPALTANFRAGMSFASEGE